MPCRSDLVFIMRLDGSEWKLLHSDYDAKKERLKDCGEEIYTFDEWIENVVKRDYINEAVDVVIATLESQIECEQRKKC